MKSVLPALLCVVLLSSCAKQYLYRFLSENETKRYRPEDIRWSYKGTVPDTVIVTNGEQLFRLPVTDNTKLEVFTTYGEKYRFQLQSIAVTGEGDFLGTMQQWRGYDYISHTDRTVMVREITNVVVMSNIPALPSQ